MPNSPALGLLETNAPFHEKLRRLEVKAITESCRSRRNAISACATDPAHPLAGRARPRQRPQEALTSLQYTKPDDQRSSLSRAGSGFRFVTRSSASAPRTFDESVCFPALCSISEAAAGPPRLLRSCWLSTHPESSATVAMMIIGRATITSPNVQRRANSPGAPECDAPPTLGAVASINIATTTATTRTSGMRMIRMTGRCCVRPPERAVNIRCCGAQPTTSEARARSSQSA